MRGRLIVVVAALLLLAACVPVAQLGERPALPTAGVAMSSDSTSLTPVPRRLRGGGTPGPLSTPAPFATPLPPPPSGPPVPVAHLVDGWGDCLSCHRTGRDEAIVIPQDHYLRTNESCLGCHSAQDMEKVSAATAQRLAGSDGS